MLGSAAALLFFVLLSALIWRHFHEVFQYAETAEVEFVPTAHGGGVEIRYAPRSEGRLQITRKGSHQTEQLTEFIERQGDGFRNKEFRWDGPDTPTARFVVKYRRGWSLHEQNWSMPGSLSAP